MGRQPLDRALRATVLLGPLLLWPAAAAGQGLEGTLEAIRASRAVPEAAVRVQGFRLSTGLGSVELVDGVLVPAAPVAGRSVEWVFIGEGVARMEPPDEVERGQLELFTGAPYLDEVFDRAVFVVALDEAGDALGRLPPAGDDGRVAAAAALLEEWRASPERRLLEVEARLVRDAAGDPLGRGFFCGYISGRSLGRFLWVVDPLGSEQVTLGQFVPADLTQRDRRQAERHLERQQRRGKLIGLVVDDLGIWDTWVSASLRGSNLEPTRGTTGVEPRHYRISASLGGRRLELEATCRVDLDVLVDGLRVVTFDMGRDLVARAVRSADGEPLEFFASPGELTVVLSRDARIAEQLSVAIDYSGSPLERVSSGAYIHRNPLGWYPHAGSIDRATYEVELSWPDRHELFGSGRVIEESSRRGQRRQVRTLDVRSLGFSFEIGSFDSVRGRVGDVDVTVAIDRVGQGASRDLAEEVLASVEGPLAYYETIFGPYPLDELTVVSSPRGFSQGLLGFVTLSTAGILDWDVWSALLGFEDRRLLIAHELAHQWWGNEVGWRSYRDQWISEAMASYAALLYERNVLAARGETRVGLGPTSGWQTVLGHLTRTGRPVESLGPVTLGVRLNSSLSTNGYEAIVYKKGVVLLDMLARLYGEEKFLDMLREVVRLAGGRVLATEDLVAALERLGGIELDWFRRQYIYGTGLPEIFYDYRIERSDEASWSIVGEARQRPSYVYTYRVVAVEDGGLDVARAARPRLDVEDSVLVVPFQIGLAPGPGAAAEGVLAERLLAGRLVLSGAVSPFRLVVDERPEIFWLDRFREVFGRFLAESRWPRRAEYERGLALAADGASDRAEEVWIAAFDREVATADERLLGIDVDVETAGRLVDVSLHLALARLYLDGDRPVDASAQVEAARRRMQRQDQWRFEHDLLAVETRLAVRAGRAEDAARQLRRALARDRDLASGEMSALLAVAGHLAGRQEEYLEACHDALERGVDLGPLDCPSDR